MTTPIQQGSSQRRDVTCFGRGRRGHYQSHSRFIGPASRGASEEMLSHQCGQSGHIRRACPQLQGRTQSGAGSLYQPRGFVTQTTSYQQILDSHHQHQLALLPPPTTTTFVQASRAEPSVPPAGGHQSLGLRQGMVYTVDATQ